MSEQAALLSLRLPSRPEAASAARKALASLNGDLHLISSERLLDAQLLTSEIVANAVRHNDGADVQLSVQASDRYLRVEVANSGAAFDPAALPGPSYERAGGWGLRIVDVVAHRWGVRPDRDTVHVWFEVDRPSAPEPLPLTGEASPPPSLEPPTDS
jgi:anti-sigma regulatory factor (Ser/Thr protein kinase)